MIGNAADDHWHGMWLRNREGSVIRMAATGEPFLNPAYDPKRPYVSRRLRPEWYVIGLVGRVLLLPGQSVAPSWLRIRRYNEFFDEWLVK